MTLRILDALSPEADNVDDHEDADSQEPATLIISSSGRPPSAISGTKVPKFDYYRARLEPLVELEDRLTRLLSSPDEDEATHLPSSQNWESYAYLNARGNGAVPASSNNHINGRPSERPTPTIYIPQKYQSYGSPVSPLNGNGSTSGSHSSSPSTSSTKSKGKEISVTSTNWKKAFTLGSKSKSPKSAHTGEIEGWWEDPDDPVHALHAAAPTMLELWRDETVRSRLHEKRIRLEESSGL
jgi:hypothetical protein